MPENTAIKVAILWHMHQPNYSEPAANRLAMPWVRLHALKDYLDMPLLAAKYDNVRVTFNLVPSLIDQIELYLSGGSDAHLDLSRTDVADLDDAGKLEILDTFFAGHATHMIDPYPRYRELHEKYLSSAGQRDVLPALFSSAELRDLQVWSNLSWVDPMFRHEQPVKALFDKQRYFTDEDKHLLLDWQLKLLGRIIPTYRELLHDDRIDISFTPYYHPILPLLCDTDVAREALPGIKLPRKRFVHPEDAEHQVVTAMKKYQDIFGRKMVGMWPSEGSVSEEVLRILIRYGIKWAATDEEIFHHSLAKSGLNRVDHPQHAVYDFGPGIKLLFRDHALSDRIGFVYSGWDAAEAVEDFIQHILNLRTLLSDRLDKVVVPVILDGENAWEFFPDDGHEFLDGLYRAINDHPEIESITMAQAAELPSQPLPSIFAGSWINHNFRIWIGHEEDNTAWDLLLGAREMLVSFENEHPDYDEQKLAFAWKQIYIAEGSDWCWWYGDEHRGSHNEKFDAIFRQHLRTVYETLEMDVPLDLHRPIHGGGAVSYTILPDDILTAQIDGRITHFYEWAGSGYYDCLKAGGAMHRVDRMVSGIHFAFDHNRFYIRLDFHDKKAVQSMQDLRVKVALYTPSPVVLELAAGQRGFVGEEVGQSQFAMDDVLELAIERTHLWPSGYGPLSFTVSLSSGKRLLETWPEGEPIQLDIPEKNKEFFWPS